MLRILLVRPGSTEFDEQGRIKGSLSLPLSAQGADQAAQTACELSAETFQAIYTSPCESAVQTAAALAGRRKVKTRCLELLQNLDHGLWHGKLIEEVRLNQPKVYRSRQDNPQTVCPPEGEPFSDAQQRVRMALTKIFRKHRHGAVALVVPEPLASVVASVLEHRDIGDVWRAECDCGRWERIDVEPDQVELNA